MIYCLVNLITQGGEEQGETLRKQTREQDEERQKEPTRERNEERQTGQSSSQQSKDVQDVALDLGEFLKALDVAGLS